jgi:glutathione S-transferase
MDLILHHFNLSPFAEKVRLMFGIKRLSWRSVIIPMIMPKPALTALTGGYRKTPVLQIGADVYCDSKRIAVELESRFPNPSLFRGSQPGFSLALSAWSDRAFFEPGAGLSMALNRTGLPQEVIADRKAFFNFMDFETLDENISHLSTQLRAQASLLEEQLSDGRDYVFGAEPELADILAYFPVWMCRGHVPSADTILRGFTRLSGWERRMAAIGEGRREEMTASEAHLIARQSVPSEGRGVDPNDALGLRVGERVAVAADDYGRDPVVGELVTLQTNEVAIRRSAAEIGTVVVHFPRTGYRIASA